MADDTMEISSEHGHNTGDEDIDIDIDFTAGHVDEDYVLEDAASTTGFGDTFPPQPSPAMRHDDLMVDDGDESYPMHMDGADLMRDDDFHTMEDEPFEMSAAPADIPPILVEESYTELTPQPQDVIVNDEVSWDTNDEPESAGKDTKFEDLETHREASREAEADGHVEEVAAVEAVLGPSAATPPKESQANTPLERSPKIALGVKEPRSPPASVLAPDAELQGHASDSPAGLHGAPTPQDSVSTDKSITAEQLTRSSSIPDVVVVYQDSEYSLFSKTQTDDIDSYFLSDRSVVDKPLNTFFAAIRDVIHSDLSNEDELCMSVEDLGLDIEEMSSSIENVTIGQIINLHEKLLQNDEVESIRPLCLLLGTRPNFSFRFGNLSSAASEGRGLSELVQWDEQSESLDGSAHVTDNDHGDELEANREGEETVQEHGEQEENELPQDSAVDDILPKDEQNPPREVSNIEGPPATEIAVINGLNDSASQDPTTEDGPPSQKIETTGSGEDEDGDLIDYSDEEGDRETEPRKDLKARSTKLEIGDNKRANGTSTDFVPLCLKPQTCFYSKCNDLLLAEYEAKNEELRRRSNCRTAEENLRDRTANLPVANDGTDYEPDTILETNNDTEYDENNKDNIGQANLAPEHGEPSTDFDEDHATEYEKYVEELYAEDGDVNGVETDQPFTEGATNEGGQEPFDDLDFEEDDDLQPQQLVTASGQETHPHDDDTTLAFGQTLLQSKEAISFGDSSVSADAPESEGASENTLEAQPVATGELTIEFNEENEDEIDYDDDVELDPIRATEPNVKDLESLSNGSGKRPRADDGTSAESKEAKRPRS